MSTPSYNEITNPRFAEAYRTLIQRCSRRAASVLLHNRDSVISSIAEHALAKTGRQFRSRLFLTVFRHANGNTHPYPVQRVAAALDVFQYWVLALDDYLDQATIRRASPSLPARLRHIHLPSEHIPRIICAGTAESMLWLYQSIAAQISQEPCSLGSLRRDITRRLQKTHFNDACAILAFFEWLIGRLKEHIRTLPSGYRVNALTYCVSIFALALYGEQLDIRLRQNLPQKNLLDVVQITTWLKTTSYSFELPLVLGLFLAQPMDSWKDFSSNDQTKKLTEIAIYAGRLYQNYDDLLVIEGSSEKNVDSDLREGCLTIVTAFIRERYEAVVRILDLCRHPDQETSNWAITLLRDWMQRKDLRTSLEQYVQIPLKQFLRHNLELIHNPQLCSIFYEILPLSPPISP